MNFLEIKSHYHQNQQVQRFSQFEEDEVIWDFFKTMRGRFLDIGSSDGIGSSNVLRLALNGWSGVCIEANPLLWARLRGFYFGADEIQTVCACVGPRNGLINFHLNNEGLSTGVDENYQALKNVVAFHGAMSVPCITPSDIGMACGKDFDFVSIDAEGMDQEIVAASAEILKNTVMLCIETDRPKQPRDEAYQARWNEVLEKVGFTKVYHQTRVNTLLIRG